MMSKMSKEEWKTKLASILREVLDEEPAEVEMGPHIIDDNELLYRWSVNDLDGQQRFSILKHLADCASCRREVAEMVRQGVLVFVSNTTLDEVAYSCRQNEFSQGDVRNRRSTWRTWALIAASIVVAAILAVVWRDWNFDSNRAILAQAEWHLQNGEPQTAYQILSRLAKEPSPGKLDNRVQDLLIKAGTQWGREALLAGDFQRVDALVREIESQGISSPELTNLRLQALREERSDLTLTLAASLEDYGYDRLGFYRFKSGPDLSSETKSAEALREAYVKAIAKYHDSVELRLNFGSFLMSLNEYEEAAAQFAKAVELAPTNPLAHTGLGLALFQQETPVSIEKALAHFQEAVRLAPDNQEFHENLAVCLARLAQEGKPRSSE